VSAENLTRFSKSPEDVAAHTSRLLTENDELLERQRSALQELSGAPSRKLCILCNSDCVNVPRFLHREIPYLECPVCGHIQCGFELAPEFLARYQKFAAIYPKLDPERYRERTSLIYKPKLDWLLEAARNLGIGDLISVPWVELGSGGGNFLSALRDSGARDIRGIDSDRRLVAQANDILGEPLSQAFTEPLAGVLKSTSARVYAAWFVLEHCFELREFFVSLKEKPAGTIFVFSVPTFGVAALFESAFTGHFARSLDSVIHLQTFTDRSIGYALDQAGYEIRAEWLFGQDADDIYRALAAAMPARSPGGVLERHLQRFIATVPAIQRAIDRNRLCDSRHILAVRK
jgi:hypothetical protein